MKDDFYLTLTSNSSLTEFPQNTNSNFKVRLPRPIRLEGNWKVALFSTSIPDPKTALPSWLTSDEPLMLYSWYSASSSNHLAKEKFLAPFRLDNVNDHVDINMMSGLDFMKTALDWFRKQRVEKDLQPNREFGKTRVNNGVSTHYPYYPKFKVEDKDVIIDSSNVEFHDFGGDFDTVDVWKAPAIFLNKKLALEMGWFEIDTNESNTQFAVRLGANLVMELRGDTLPHSSDIKAKFDANGYAEVTVYNSR